ncbi:TonB-dependent receptor [Aureibaculum sp. 2210JD6-5]|uniref:TonB-dependent receptor n=1 Tax=Aureibaculum sp. 2210JD6-5 TaxID=3103957 RepID=UPI002AADCD56|nr:TonB-dependent receptor [Aureibaculum sp. 2210JD6-5]MDY7394695.1 TonB-dependent receptor [Aureibaculum sp. 2210JD6-5]
MKKFLLLTFIVSYFSSTAQTITVLDEESKFPVANVAVFNEDKTKRKVSDKNGKVDLSIFKFNDILSFTHVGYIEFEVLKRQITTDKIFLRTTAQQLNEVFLSTSKSQESRKRIAEQIDVFSIKDIQRVSPQTSADMLAEMPGIKVQKSQFGGGSPVLRGMEANRVLLVVDGVRMNNAIYRKGHLQNSITVSPNMLDRVEVIFGPSSVVYGSDALGGVIHYYTRKPKISEETDFDASFLTRYSTVNNEVTAQAGVELSFKRFATFTSVSRSDFGDLRMGKNRNHGFDDWGKVFEYSNNTDDYYSENPVENSNPNLQKNTGYDQTDLLQKFYIPLSEKTDLNVNFQYSTSSDIPRFDRLTEISDGELRFAEWYYGPQQRFLASTQLEINPEKKWLDNGSITLAYQNIKESRINRKFGSLDRTIRKENVDVFSANADFSVPLTKLKDRILSYGAEFTHNNVESNPEGKTLAIDGDEITGFSDTFAVQSRYADGGSTYTTSAVYANYRQDISKKSTLNSGIRFTQTYLAAKWIDETFFKLPDNNFSVNNASISATLGYVYKPSESLQLNSVLSTGFRSPNLDDLGKVREQGGDVTVPNIDLGPEYAYNAELGVLKYFNEKKFYVGGTVYYTLLDNYITREGFSLNGKTTMMYDGEEANIVANVNKDNAYIFGGTLDVKGRLTDHLSTRGSITYTKGKAYDTQEPLSSIPPLFGMVALNHEKGKLSLGVDVKFNGRKRPEDYNITEDIDRYEDTPYIATTDSYYGTPAWTTLNFNSKYRLTKNLDFMIAVDNIFDTHYREFASGISAPGRNFSFTLLGNF